MDKMTDQKCVYVHCYGEHKGDQCSRNKIKDIEYCIHHKEFINGRCIGLIGSGPNKGKQCDKPKHSNYSNFCMKHEGSAKKIIEIKEKGLYKCYTYRCINDVEIEKSYCNKCSETKKKIIELKKKCTSIILQGPRKGEICNEPTDDEFCTFHIRHESLVSSAKALGKKVCGDGLRCTNLINSSDKSCEECLEKQRIKDKILYDKKASNKSCCIDCGKKDIDFAITMDGIISRYCLKCYDKMRSVESLRDRSIAKEGFKNPELYYKRYKHDAERKERCFELSYEQFISIVSKPCSYCGYYKEIEFNGIDRSNSILGYIVSNCVPCCKLCNIFKSNYNIEEFINHCNSITLFTKENKYSDKRIIWKSCNDTSYTIYKTAILSRKRTIEFDIDKETYDSLKLNQCYLCGFIPTKDCMNGIDRIDSTKGYTSSNIAPCCAICNRMKNQFTYDTFINQCAKISIFNKLYEGTYDQSLISYKNIIKRLAKTKMPLIEYIYASDSESEEEEIKPLGGCGVPSVIEHIELPKEKKIVSVKTKEIDVIKPTKRSLTIPKQWKTINIYDFIKTNQEIIYKNYILENNEVADKFDSEFDCLVSEVKSAKSFDDVKETIKMFIKDLTKARTLKLLEKSKVPLDEREDRVVYPASTVAKLANTNKLDGFKKYIFDLAEEAKVDIITLNKQYDEFEKDVKTFTNEKEQIKYIEKFLTNRRAQRYRASHPKKKEKE
jgi:hypothetical protein